MKWIEVIELRSINSKRDRLEAKLKSLMAEVAKKENKQTITTYSRMLIDTDFRLHIHHESSKPEYSGSRVGLCFASALKKFGLVKHSMWVEMESG